MKSTEKKKEVILKKKAGLDGRYRLAGWRRREGAGGAENNKQQTTTGGHKQNRLIEKKTINTTRVLTKAESKE